MRVIKMKCTIFYFIFTRARASSCAQIHETGFHNVVFCSSSWVCVVAVTLVPESREAVRRKNLWFIWTWTSLSCRRQGQDLTLGLGLVDIFKLKHVNQYMVGPFDWQHRGDYRDICRCASCGKYFCLSQPGKEFVYKILQYSVYTRLSKFKLLEYKQSIGKVWQKS